MSVKPEDKLDKLISKMDSQFRWKMGTLIIGFAILIIVY